MERSGLLQRTACPSFDLDCGVRSVACHSLRLTCGDNESSPAFVVTALFARRLRALTAVVAGRMHHRWTLRRLKAFLHAAIDALHAGALLGSFR